MADRPLQGSRILVVEDEYFLAADIQEALTAAGADVVGPVATVDEAAALLASAGTIDLAILDINIQGEPIFPIADRLRSDGVPFAFATGFDQWLIPERFENVPHMEKPQKASSIVAQMASLLNAAPQGRKR